MRIIAVMCQKGGVGKTSTAVFLAVAAHLRGLRALVIDTDPQRSAEFWSKLREGRPPEVIGMDAIKLSEALAALRAAPKSSRPDLVIIDTAPHLGPDAVDIAQAADVVVVTLPPGSALDLHGALPTIDLVKEMALPSIFFLALAPKAAPEIRETRRALSEMGLRVAEKEFDYKRDLWRCVGRGRAAHDVDAEAGAQIDSLLDELLAMRMKKK